MGHRLSKIVTRTGDTGSTGLGDGTRVAFSSNAAKGRLARSELYW
jgi:cob(I)alamin adenosyltransferase